MSEVIVFVIIIWAAFVVYRQIKKGCKCNKCDQCKMRNFMG